MSLSNTMLRHSQAVLQNAILQRGLQLRTDIVWLVGGVFTALFLLFPGAFLEGELAVPGQMLYLFYPWKTADVDVDPGNTLRSDIFDTGLQHWSQVSMTLSHLWSPAISGGVPTTSLITGGHTSPLVAPFLLVASPVMALHLSMLARVAAAFVGTYLLLRQLGCVPFIAYIGGLSFAMGGFNSVWLPWTVGAVTAFAPWILLSIEVIRQRRLVGTVLLTGSTYGLISGGFFPVAAHYLYFAAAYVFFLLLMPLLLRKQYRALMVSAVACGSGVFIGLGLTGLYILPTVEFFDFIDVSYRSASGYLPSRSAIQLIFPFFNGNHTFTRWLGPLNYNETTGYMGIVVLASFILFPLVILISKNRYKIIFFSLAVFIFLSIIYGIGPTLHLAGRLPVLNTGGNWRMLSVFGFCMTIAASLVMQSLFVDHWSTFIRSQWIKRTLFLGATVLLLGFGIGLAYLISSYGIQEIRSVVNNVLRDSPYITTNIYWLRMASAVFAVGLLMVAVWSLFWGIGTKRRWIFAGSVIIAVMLDMGIFNYRQNSTMDAEAIFPVTPGIEFLQQQADQPYKRVLALDNTFFLPGSHVIYGIPSTVSHAFVPTPRRAYMRAYLGDFRTPTAIMPSLNSTNLNSPLLNLVGTSYIVVRPDSNTSNINVEQPFNDYPIPLPADGTPLQQTFEVRSGTISQACVKAATYSQIIPSDEGTFTMTLSHGEAILDESTYDLAVLTDNNWFCAEFALDDATVGQHSLTFRRSGAEAFSIALWGNRQDPYRFGEASGSTVPEMTDFVFNIIYDLQGGEELAPQFQRVYQGDDLVVYHNRDAIFAYVTNQIRTTDSISDLLNYLQSETEIVVLDTPIDIQDTEACYTELVPTSFSNDSVSYTLNGDCSGILATSESYYPGWEVEVDGEPREVLRVNGILRGVQVDDDDTKVTFYYRPQSFELGGAVTLISFLSFVLLCGAAIVFGAKEIEQVQN